VAAIDVANKLLNDNNYHLELDEMQAINKINTHYYVNLCNLTHSNLDKNQSHFADNPRKQAVCRYISTILVAKVSPS
jgi:hypothetical protein